jgi:hypothetical protein
MALKAERGRRGSSSLGWFSWWTAGGVSLLLRLPALLIFAVLVGWYVFRGLVRMAFIFDANALLSFLLAPILLPAAALPAICTWLILRLLPRIWRDATILTSRKVVNTIALIPAAVLVAVVIDRLENFGLYWMGLRLPPFLFTSY